MSNREDHSISQQGPHLNATQRPESLNGVAEDVDAGSVEDNSGPERIEKSSSSKNIDVIVVKEKSSSPEEHGLHAVNCIPESSSTRSSSSYTIEEVQAMVSKLEKYWAEIKAKQRQDVAK